MKHLIIITPYGDKYRISLEGLLTQYTNTKFSDNWRFMGMSNVKSAAVIPLTDINDISINDIRRNLLDKNGDPKWTVMDLDHGTQREWGNSKLHGIKSIYFEEASNWE